MRTKDDAGPGPDADNHTGFTSRASSMTVSAKCYYGLRAIYALAEHDTATPMKASDIAERQHIPIKFLESILSQLRGGGFVNSRRGAEGGYILRGRPTA